MDEDSFFLDKAELEYLKNGFNNNLQALAKNYKLFIRQDSEMLKKRYTDAIMAPVGKKFTKPFSKKHKLWLHNKEWNFHFPSHYTYARVKAPRDVKYTGRGIRGKSGIRLVYYSPTRMGTIYFVDCIETTGVMMAFTAHFFDRLTQRAYTQETSRIGAIFKFMDEIGRTSFCVGRGDVIRMVTSHGIGLGYRAALAADGVDLKVHMDFFQTFVSNDMLKPSQKRYLEECKDEFQRLQVLQVEQTVEETFEVCGD
jgi:hypothetical protein